MRKQREHEDEYEQEKKIKVRCGEMFSFTRRSACRKVNTTYVKENFIIIAYYVLAVFTSHYLFLCPAIVSSLFCISSPAFNRSLAFSVPHIRPGLRLRLGGSKGSNQKCPFSTYKLFCISSPAFTRSLAFSVLHIRPETTYTPKWVQGFEA